MITLTRTYIRPNKTTKWHWDVLDGTEIGAYVGATYDKTKLLSNTRVIDKNRLIATFTMTWVDRETFDAYDNDTNAAMVAYYRERDDYNALVGISMGPKVIV